MKRKKMALRLNAIVSLVNLAAIIVITYLFGWVALVICIVATLSAYASGVCYVWYHEVFPLEDQLAEKEDDSFERIHYN